MIKRIADTTNPELFVLQYSATYCVTNLTLIPKFFFVLNLIEKRPPLSATARRAGWVGCNILYNNIPTQGKISIISNGVIENIEKVVNSYSRVKMLQMSDIGSRGVDYRYFELYKLNSKQ